MKRFLPIFIFWILWFVLFPVKQVNAQHGDAPPLPPDAWKGQVSGKGVNFLVLESSGLTIQGDGLTQVGERTLEDGSKFNVFKARSLKPGASLQLVLSGKPRGETAMDTTTTQNTANTGIGIGAGILGLSLLGAGVWWWRRREGEDAEEISHDTVEGLLTEIQYLEQAYERGEMPEEEYEAERAGLRERLKAAASPTVE